MTGCGSIRLDPEPVVGGHYTFWNPTYDRNVRRWLGKPRPEKVSPPDNLSAKQKLAWDGRAEADRRPWYVEHRCGKTAAQIVEEWQRREKRA
ncbi:hypothetical protein [Nonomuraea jiangxiensis]|uniref:Uncharacterized protein n=1 Tax=Nonomuraea jiangxiensis TaxID=633440 RepID=A0A1G8T2A8_9ACTN|nr:hypothetical protein [Nonomuraea jiangxiensis]SDJ35541.1 hypothetical protein SAMN05421869_11045 [Nonomuraea jiangxiensis]